MIYLEIFIYSTNCSKSNEKLGNILQKMVTIIPFMLFPCLHDFFVFPIKSGIYFSSPLKLGWLCDCSNMKMWWSMFRHFRSWTSTPALEYLEYCSLYTNPVQLLEDERPHGKRGLAAQTFCRLCRSSYCKWGFLGPANSQLALNGYKA